MQIECSETLCSNYLFPILQANKLKTEIDKINNSTENIKKQIELLRER